MSINRHLARGIALQVLYELDANNNLSLEENKLKDIVDNNCKEFANVNDNGFIIDLLKTIQERLITIDNIISQAAPEWPLDKINIMDRNIIRIGLAELLFFSEKVPPKVAIDEAIELAKTYSGATSHKFVNGVLGNIYKEMGEPRKNETTPIKKEIENVFLAGGLVYSIHEGKIYLAFVRDIFKHWTLPKGKILEGEDSSVCALRKIKEEIGINVVIKDKLKENSYLANVKKVEELNIEELSKPKEKLRKNILYFLAEGNYEPLKLEEESTGLLEAKWFLLDEIQDLNIYDDIKTVIAEGVEKINNYYEYRK